MQKDSKKHETRTDANNVLAAGFLYTIGDFTILFDEDSHELKINTSHASKHLKVRPKADNSIEVAACR
jgi:hypothetical protein